MCASQSFPRAEHSRHRAFAEHPDASSSRAQSNPTTARIHQSLGHTAPTPNRALAPKTPAANQKQ